MEKASNEPATTNDYQSLQSDERYELIGGQFQMVPSPNRYHQNIVLNLARQLADHVDKENNGNVYVAPMDVHLSETDVVQPDVMYVSDDHQERLKDEFIDGPPDITVEVLSESTSQKDRLVKRQLYEQSGVPEFWLVSPQAHTLEVMALNQEGNYEENDIVTSGDILQSSVLPNLELDTERIFDHS